MSYFGIFNKLINVSKFKFKRQHPVVIGDILGLSFRSKGYSYFFEGICIGIKNKKMIDPETTLVLRNILENVGVEVSFSYFYNRLFFMRINNYKRKKLSYSRSKLFYIRNKLNSASRVA